MSNPVAAVALAMAATELAKRVFPEVDRRWLPLVALAVAEVWAFGLRNTGNPVETALIGLAIAAFAVGIFSGTRAVAGQ
ncbi:MAG: hypothetical protein ABIH03_11695 [Pseudomonadota bacterium]